MLLCFVQLRIGGGRGEERYKKQTVEIITSGTLAAWAKHSTGPGEGRPQITIKSGSQAVRLLHKAFHSRGSAMLKVKTTSTKILIGRAKGFASD